MFSQVEEWFQVVVDTAVDGVILINAKGSVLLFNPACERLFGYRADEVIGRSVATLMPPFNVELNNAPSTSHRTGQRRIIGAGREVEGRRKDGTSFSIELSVGEATRAGERLYVGVIHDISERKQAEEQRQLFIEHLIASNEERGHFSFVASHDLQEHLRIVLSFNGLVLDEYGPQLDDKARQYLSLSLNAANQMQELVDDLREYCRLGVELEREKAFDAAAELDLVLESLDEIIRDSHAQIAVGELPFLFGNPVRFRRLLQNLLGNALKYVPPQVAPFVEIAVEDEGDFWRFCVKDNGIGIEPAYHLQIFQPFKRLHARSHYSGTGLGLPICKRIVAGFGGRIWVESEPGAGSSFFFTIGRKRQDQ